MPAISLAAAPNYTAPPPSSILLFIRTAEICAPPTTNSESVQKFAVENSLDVLLEFGLDMQAPVQITSGNLRTTYTRNAFFLPITTGWIAPHSHIELDLLFRPCHYLQKLKLVALSGLQPGMHVGTNVTMRGTALHASCNTSAQSEKEQEEDYVLQTPVTPTTTSSATTTATEHWAFPDPTQQAVSEEAGRQHRRRINKQPVFGDDEPTEKVTNRDQKFVKGHWTLDERDLLYTHLVSCDAKPNVLQLHIPSRSECQIRNYIRQCLKNKSKQFMSVVGEECANCENIRSLQDALFDKCMNEGRRRKQGGPLQNTPSTTKATTTSTQHWAFSDPPTHSKNSQQAVSKKGDDEPTEEGNKSEEKLVLPKEVTDLMHLRRKKQLVAMARQHRVAITTKETRGSLATAILAARKNKDMSKEPARS